MPSAIRRVVEDGLVVKRSLLVCSNDISMNVNVTVEEPLPFFLYHEIHSYTLATNSTTAKAATTTKTANNKSKSKPSRVSDLASFSTTKDGQGGDVARWTTTLAPHSCFVASMRSTPRFLHRDWHVADSSRGREIPPSVVTFTATDSSSFPPQRLATSAAIVSLPLPDFSMPFNVIVLVNTLMTFLLGSIVNSLLNKRKKQTMTAASSKSPPPAPSPSPPGMRD